MLLPCCENHKCLQKLPNTPGESPLSPFKNDWFRETLTLGLGPYSRNFQGGPVWGWVGLKFLVLETVCAG